ncbi:unnamed protein product [Pedinophyceae sp. YPF-701]|nr:unnamed protein product [Pedinophyceae sp. YPF-701]
MTPAAGAPEGGAVAGGHVSDSDEDAKQAQVGKETWVQCDRCDKWRRVQQALLAGFKDDDSWTCDMNTDAKFASCEVPQEMTDEQIDQLEADPAPKARPFDHHKIPQVWQRILSSIYLYRKKRVTDEDDMVCMCAPRTRADGSQFGCGSDCVNRQLFIECNAESCPCGTLCKNQMFSRREWCKLRVDRAGGKGFGLFADQAVPKGGFVIEYVGEVIDEEGHERRRAAYLEQGQRHYYFMNIGNGEVIDACQKGNLGRFVNHSCEPNCETQKWNVGGEMAIGFFALRDIAAGEEITFDYNFERYGDRPVRCLCGSASCRTFIGGSGEGIPAEATFAEVDDCSDDPWYIEVAKEAELEAEMQKYGIPTIAELEGPIDASAPRRKGKKGKKASKSEARESSPPRAKRDAKKQADAAADAGGARRDASALPPRPKRVADSSGDEDDDVPLDVARRAAQSAGQRTSAGADDKERSATPGPRAPSPSVAASSLDRARKSAGAGASRQAMVMPWQMIPRIQRRSEVERKLDGITLKSGGIRDSDCALKLLRLFNICLPGAGTSVDGTEITGQTRGRIRDLSMVLEVVLTTKGRALKQAIVKAGALQQLMYVIQRLVSVPSANTYTMIEKALTVLRHLRVSRQELESTRSSQTNFAQYIATLAVSNILRANPAREAARVTAKELKVPLPDFAGPGGSGHTPGGPPGSDPRGTPFRRSGGMPLPTPPAAPRPSRDVDGADGQRGLPPPPPLGGHRDRMPSGDAPRRRSEPMASPPFRPRRDDPPYRERGASPPRDRGNQERRDSDRNRDAERPRARRGSRWGQAPDVGVFPPPPPLPTSVLAESDAEIARRFPLPPPPPPEPEPEPEPQPEPQPANSAESGEIVDGGGSDKSRPAFISPFSGGTNPLGRSGFALDLGRRADTAAGKRAFPVELGIGAPGSAAWDVRSVRPRVDDGGVPAADAAAVAAAAAGSSPWALLAGITPAAPAPPAAVPDDGQMTSGHTSTVPHIPAGTPSLVAAGSGGSEEAAEVHAWDEPGPGFREWVKTVLQKLLWGYVKPDGGSGADELRLDESTAADLLTRLSCEVVEREMEAFRQRRHLGQQKAIEAVKVEGKLRQMVVKYVVRASKGQL